MKYQNASAILPEFLVKQLQKYVQGGYLYIPTKKEARRGWGELSGARKEIDSRNAMILEAFAQGTSLEELAEAYFLSVCAIRKIVYRK